MKPKTIAIIELSLLGIALVLFAMVIAPKPPAQPVEVAVEPTTRAVPHFPDVTLEAKSAYVYDSQTGKALYQKEADTQLPLASLTKLMSALTASQVIPNYMLVKITADDLREEGDTGLHTGEEWNISKLIDYTLVVSSNDGVRAIAGVAGSQIGNSPTTTAQQFFIQKMNDNAREIGLDHTRFLNASGLDESTVTAGGYGSARDMAVLVDHILKTNPHLIEATSFRELNVSSNDATHDAVNTNRAILDIPNVIGSKTGFTNLSGGNVVVALNAGLDRPIIISVLGSSFDGRFTDLKTLVDATMMYLGSTTSDIVVR